MASSENASRSCGRAQTDVGCGVTLISKMLRRRRPPSQQAGNRPFRDVPTWPTSVVDENRTYRPDLPGRRTQRDAQAKEGMMTVIGVLEVERHEVRLLVAVRVVVVALVEPDVTNSIPAVSGSVPGGSARVLEFLGVERGISVHSLQIDVPYVTSLTGVDRPPPLLPESRWAAAIVTVNKCDPYRVVVEVLELERHGDSLLCRIQYVVDQELLLDGTLSGNSSSVRVVAVSSAPLSRDGEEPCLSAVGLSGGFPSGGRGFGVGIVLSVR